MVVGVENSAEVTPKRAQFSRSRFQALRMRILRDDAPAILHELRDVRGFCRRARRKGQAPFRPVADSNSCTASSVLGSCT